MDAKSSPSAMLVTIPTELGALATGVTPATVRKWASRGKLTRYGSAGRAEYDLNELYELADAGRRRQRGRTSNRAAS